MRLLATIACPESPGGTWAGATYVDNTQVIAWTKVSLSPRKFGAHSELNYFVTLTKQKGVAYLYRLPDQVDNLHPLSFASEPEPLRETKEYRVTTASESNLPIRAMGLQPFARMRHSLANAITSSPTPTSNRRIVPLESLVEREHPKDRGSIREKEKEKEKEKEDDDSWLVSNGAVSSLSVTDTGSATDLLRPKSPGLASDPSSFMVEPIRRPITPDIISPTRSEEHESAKSVFDEILHHPPVLKHVFSLGKYLHSPP